MDNRHHKSNQLDGDLTLADLCTITQNLMAHAGGYTGPMGNMVLSGLVLAIIALSKRGTITAVKLNRIIAEINITGNLAITVQ